MQYKLARRKSQSLRTLCAVSEDRSNDGILPVHLAARTVHLHPRRSALARHPVAAGGARRSLRAKQTSRRRQHDPGDRSHQHQNRALSAPSHATPLPRFNCNYTQRPSSSLCRRSHPSSSTIAGPHGKKLVATIVKSYTATVKLSSLRVTARYSVSRSNGTRPASVISRTKSARRIPCGVVAPASW